MSNYLDTTPRGRQQGKTLLAAVFALLPILAAAQTTDTSTTASTPAIAPVTNTAQTGQPIKLDPFEVNTSKDTSYGALNSNSIVRFNTALDKVPVSADVFTDSFMQDLDVTSVNDMLANYGAGMGVVLSNPSSDALLNQPGDRVVIGDRFTPQQIGVRGLSAGNIRRDGFEGMPTNTSSTSSFDVGRVEVLRGPEGLLYGAGGAGGTIVATTKEATFGQTFGDLKTRIDEYGSKSGLVDYNMGTENFAARFAFINQTTDTRRTNIGDELYGNYGQFAFKLPFNTVLRIEGEYTYDWRLLSNPTMTVNFGGVANDPRNGDRLDYLLFTNQTGAINPATGQAFSRFGAIDNGNVNWSDYASYGGQRSQDLIQNYILEAKADTVWSSWLSTTIGVDFDRDTDRSNTINATLNAPLENSNPLNNWAVSSNMQDVLNQQLYKEFRASALITKNFFDDRIKTQTAGGFDTLWRGYGAIDDGYFLADSSGNIVITPGANNLGRTAIPTTYWSVDNGPVEYPLIARGTPLFLSPQDGKTYARTELNLRSPAYINPGNPLGDATLNDPTQTGVIATPGVAGINQGGYGEQVKTYGYYFANYTSFWDDWVDMLAGYRMTKTHTHIPNGSSNIYGVGKDYVNPANFNDPSYNLGLNGRITHWLRWYVDLSATYNDGVGQDDPIGNPPPPTYSHGWEAGFKFTPMDSKISGSLAYYYTSDHNDNVNYGGAIINDINPQGLNGVDTGPAGRNSFVNLDEKSHGLELILTANPTPDWRIRFSATQSEGTVLTTRKYGIVYNDQFYTDGKGNVTYSDGSPFLVPTNATLVSKLTAVTNPSTILTSGVASEQLTTAMIGDPTNPYYAWAGNAVNPNGQIDSGIAGTPTTPVGLALRYFNKGGNITPLTGALGLPFSDIQYAWPDPNHTGGTFTVAEDGDPTVGYPVFRISFTNSYQFSHGPLKGFGATVAVNDAWQYRTYIYNDPSGARPLFAAPELGWQINLFPYYIHKFKRVTWRTQIDINNLTNHYILVEAPNNGSGFNTAANIGIYWQGQPRSYAWTNTISF